MSKKEKPVVLVVKWASFPRRAATISLKKSGNSLIAIPKVSPSDQWWLVCNTQALAETLRASLNGTYTSLKNFGIDRPAISVKVGSTQANGDFSEVALIAMLMGAGFSNIKETERPWGRPLKK